MCSKYFFLLFLSFKNKQNNKKKILSKQKLRNFIIYYIDRFVDTYIHICRCMYIANRSRYSGTPIGVCKNKRLSNNIIIIAKFIAEVNKNCCKFKSLINVPTDFAR